jgi:hypothetical protein
MLIVGQNSYIDTTDADSYFSERLNSDTWTGTNEKEAALIQATKIIDTYNFTGQKTDPSQKLKFPRTGVYYDNVELPPDVIPTIIKDAVCELAIWLLTEDFTAPDDLAKYSSVSVGALSVSVAGSSAPKLGNFALPPLVLGLIGSLVASSSQIKLVKG